MNHQPHQQHSGAWATFTYVSFAASVAMAALGILSCPWTWRHAATWPSGC